MAKTPLKLLFFIEDLGCGGAEKSLVSLLGLLDYDRVEVDLLMLNPAGAFLRLLPAQVRVMPLSIATGFGHSVRRLLFSAKLRAMHLAGIRRHGAEAFWPFVKSSLSPIEKHYDVAIAYQQGLPTYFISEFVNADRRLAWINIDLKGAGYREAFNRSFYQKYDKCVAVSSELYQKLCNSDFVEPSRLTTIYDILNVELIRRMASDFEVPHIDRGIELVTVGRMVAQKNYPLAVETARVLRDQGMRFHWTFVGDGESRPQVDALIDAYSLRDSITLAGMQPNPYPYMKAADIYVHTASFEGFGLTIAEAKILGRPVVSTDFTVVYDQISDGVNGLISPMDAENLSQRIIRLASDEGLRSDIVAAINAERNLTATTEVKKFYSLIGL